MMKIRSNLLSKLVAIPVLHNTSTFGSHFWVPSGLVAAMIVVLVLIVQTIPAFATLIVYYSIASWILPLSSFFIYENSSMQHSPQSDKTKAPASKINSLPSLKAETVKPALVVPIPVVITERFDILTAL